MSTPATFLKLASYSVLSTLVFAAVANSAHAAKAPTRKSAPSARDVEVDSVKEAYWNRTADGDVEVVQNRLYSKKHRLSLQGAVGTVTTDPFQSVKSLGGAVGFHFTETLGVNAVYKKYLVSDSSYMNELRQGLQPGASTNANTNKPSSFMGGELQYSPLYGKISLSGSSIVHYDAHFLLGAGMTDTESGKYFTPTVGFGPQFYLSNTFAIRLDYRLAIFKEDVPNKVLVNSGPVAFSRTNYQHQVALGMELFL
jgi:outer membrane beta-barrel protein